MRNPRVLLAVALAVAALVVGGVIAIAGSGGDDKESLPTTRGRLTLEQFSLPGTAETELLISMRETRLNTPDRTGGRTSVELSCADAAGAEIFRRRTQWPLLEETGYPYPHIHQPAGRKLLRSIRGCRVTGPGLDLVGRVSGPPPPADQ